MNDREQVIRGLNDIGGFIAGRLGIEQAHNFLRTIDDTVELLKEQEAVIRCKDCKNLGYTNSHWFCKWLNRCVDEDWFCADWERKEGR